MAGGLPAAGGEDFPPFTTSLRIDGEHDCLRTKTRGDGCNQVGTHNGGGVYGDLVGTGFENVVSVIEGADSASYGEGDEQLGGSFADGL